MGTGNGNGQQEQEAIAYPLVAILPKEAYKPQFQLMGQWHTGTGILCPIHNVPVQGLGPDMIVQMFVDLVNQGMIGQVVVKEDGSKAVEDLPKMDLTMRAVAEMAAPAEQPPAAPPSRIILLGD